MGPYIGDFRAGSTIYVTWDTNDGNGGSIDPTVDGLISVFRDDNPAPTVAGVTDTRNYALITGIHVIRIVTADAFYAIGHDYHVILTLATIDGQVVNSTLARFSIENRIITSADIAFAIRMMSQLAQSEFANCILVKAVAAIPAQGITPGMAASGCIQYETIKVSLTRNFVAPDFTYYLLWRYDALGDVAERKPSLGIVW